MKFSSGDERPIFIHSQLLPVRIGGLLALLCLAMGLSACSAGGTDAARGDVAPARLGSRKLSPEQCAAGGQIQYAALRPDNYDYFVQPVVVLSVDLYLNPECKEEDKVPLNGKA